MGTMDPCRNLLRALFACLFVANGLYAKEQCKKGCPSADSGILKYQPGNVYEYNFDSVVTISVTGTDTDETSLKVLGHANVYAAPNCEYTLQLDKVIITATKDSLKKQATQDITKPVQFTLSSGALEPQICVDEADTDYSVNIKRAIISMLQASEKAYETDVFGVCPTSTKVSNVGGVNVVTKVRNLNSCAYRETVSNGLVSGVVNEKAGVKSSALLTGDYTKEQKINNGIIENVELYEEYHFVPTSTRDAGAKAKVKTNLKLVKQGPGAGPQVKGVPKTIIFKHPRPVPTKNTEALRKVFESTVNQVDGYAKSDAANLFTELIRLMRTADTDTLTDLSGAPHPNKNLAKKVYLDALFRTGTSEAIKAIVRQIPKMSEAEKRIAFLSFNLVESVNRDALTKAANILNPGAPKEAYLAIGNLVSKYCRENPCEDDEINAISKKFGDNLKQCKAATRAEEDRIIYALKGIRNTHKIANTAVGPLTECVSNDRSARIRVAALQAFTAAGCNPALQQKALSILRDRNEDSEIRIEAYLAAVSCPNAELANHIAEIINTETVYQVGGFISSHLRSIRDSTDLTREAARHYLGNIRITKKFPIDPRRYSFNSELSYALDSLGVGASADYNLVYSQHGFLPRSGRLNLTSEVFGKQFNVLEFSARQENMESVLEYYFGPKGYLNEHAQEFVDKIAQGLSREKRSVSDEATKFSKHYKSYGGKLNTDINLDLSFKMFGSEFFFLSLGDNVPTTADELNHQLIKTLKESREGAKNFEHKIQYHSLFLDTEVVYPSGIGFPIELVAQGTAAGNLNVASNLDLQQIQENPLNSQGRVKIVPSVNLNVNGQLRVIGSLVSTGVRVSTNLHSATGADVQLQLLNDGNAFNLDIELPRRNIDLIELKHDIEFFVADRERQAKVFPMKQKKKSTTHPGQFDQLQMFGLTVDYTATVPEINVGTAPILLCGPIHVALKLESEQKISLKGVHEKTENVETWEMRYDTPGSQVPHTSALKFELGTTPKGDPNSKLYARASFENPQKRLALEAGGVDNNNEFALYGQYEHDSEKTTAKVGFTKHGQEYRPLIQTVSSKDNQPRNEIAGYKADGRVVVEQAGDEKKYRFENFRVIEPKGEPFILNGWASIGQYKSQADLDITSNGQNIKVKALGSIAPGAYKFNGYVTDPATGKIHGGELYLQYQEGNAQADINLQTGEHSFDLHHKYEWEAPEKTTPHVTFENEITLKTNKKVAGAAKVNGQVKADHITVDIAASRQDKKLAFYMDFIEDKKNPNDYKLDVIGKLNQHFIDIKSKSEVKGGKAHVDNVVATSWGTHLTAKGEIGQRYSAQDVDIDLQGTAVLSSKDKPTNWILKVNGSPEKTTGEFKLIRENADIITFTGELNRPGDKPMTGKVNLSIKDNLVAKGDFKVAKNGRGDLSLLLNLKKVGKKLKAESKFTIQAPKYDIETTVYFDPDKDKSKKIYYKTENVADKQKFSTKNILEFATEKYVFDASAVVKGDAFTEGEQNYKFVFILPSGRQLDGDMQRKLSTKGGLTGGTAVLNLNDKLPSNQKRSFLLEGKLENYDPKTKTFSVQHNVVFTNFDGKNAQVNTVVKHLPKGHFNMGEVSINAKGELLEAPFEMHYIVDEYCEEHAVYRISGRYADKVDGNINGNYHVGGEGKPASYELQVNLNAPFSNIKTIAIQSSGKLLDSKEQNGVDEGEIHYYHKIGDNEPFKLDVSGKGNDNHGSFQVETHIPNHTPIKLDGTYLQEETDKSSKYQYTSNLVFEGGKIVKTSIDLQTVENDVFNLHYTLQTPYDNAKNIDLIFKGKKSNEDTYTTSSQLNYNGKNYGLNTVVTLNERKSSIDITCNCPDKTAKISSNLEKFGERKAQASLILENVGDINFVGSAEGGFESYEDFYIKVDVDSEKLKLNQFHIEANSQKGSGGKGVTFLVKDATQQIISGTATYNVKHEKSKAIVEGQGSIQYYQKATTANFKLVRQSFDLATDKEVGFSYTFNGSFGPKNIVSALKATSKNFHVKLASCEDKKQCTNFEVQSVVTMPDPKKPDYVQHESMVLIDLRELGYPHEFELQSKTTRNGFKIEHEIEANIISNNNNKYQFIANRKPGHNIIQIKLPKRDIVIETKYSSPQKSIFGHYEESITYYLDHKNKPNEKAQIIMSADVNGVENVAINAKGSVKFEHPAMRPLQVMGQVELNREKQLAQSQMVFDVFRLPNQKVIAVAKYQGVEQSDRGYNVTTESSLKSAGLGFDYSFTGHSALSIDRREISAGGTFVAGKSDIKAGVYLFGSKDRFELLLNALNTEILSINGIYQKNKAKVDSKLQILGSKPLTLTSEAEPSKLGFVLKQDDLFQVTCELKPSKEFKFVVNGAGKKLYNGRLALDPAHFLAATYEVNQEDIKAFVKTVEEKVKEDTKHARAKIDKQFQSVRELVEKQVEAIKGSTPDVSKLQASYQQQLIDILKELEEDPVLRDFVGVYRQTYEQFMKALQEIIKTISESFQKSQQAVSELYAKLSAAFKDQILPEMQAYAKRVTTEIGQFYTEAIKILGSSMEQTLKALKSIEADLGKLGKPLQELLKPLSELINEFIKSLAKEWEDFWNEIESYYNTLPSSKEVYQQVKERLEQITIFEEILPLANEAINQLQEYVSTEEGKEFLGKLHEYIDAKLSRAQVNDVEKLEELYSALLSAIQSFILALQGDGIEGGFFTPLPYTIDTIRQIPGWVSFKFSPLNFLRNENIDSFTDLFQLRPVLDVLPPYELQATVVEGEHIFTFDGRHIAFPGSCKYILAQDFVNNNFSVIANLKDGKMKSIVLVDKSNFVEVNDQGAIKLNGQPTEYPVHKDDIHAWRRYYTVSLLSKYGVFVLCATDLRICHVKVNGFYTSKTRGLLGNGNAEPYDDFTQPNGLITDDYATFGNTYGLGSCPPVAPEAHDHARSPICKELFDFDSTLVLGYLFIDPVPYRRACDHAVEKATNKEDVACTIAAAYASAARVEGLPVTVPVKCLKCNPNTQEQRDIGTVFESKVPGNKADVVFVVDTAIGKDVLGNLVTPIITDLRSQLKNRGISDVQIAVIGYDQTQKYPTLFTSHGKLNYQGNLNEANIAGPKYEEFENANEKLQKLNEDIRENRARSFYSSDAQAFNLAMDYPFRAGASKVIVAVRSDSLEYANPLKFFGATVTNEVAKAKGISLHLIGPVKELTVEGLPAEKIVGFNSRVVATPEGRDAKKRSKLQYSSDMGVDMVHADGGWVFALQNFEQQKSPDQKKVFAQAISSNIAEQTSKLEVVSDCICTLSYGLHAEDLCTMKSSQFLSAKKPAAARG